MSRAIFTYIPDLDSDNIYSPTLASLDGQEVEIVDYESETHLYKLRTENGTTTFHAFDEEVQELFQ